MAAEPTEERGGLIAAGGWCAPNEQTYDLNTLTHREWRNKYGWPEDHDPWEYMDSLDIERIAGIIENGPEGDSDSDSEDWLPNIQMRRGGFQWESADGNEQG